MATYYSALEEHGSPEDSQPKGSMQKGQPIWSAQPDRQHMLHAATEVSLSLSLLPEIRTFSRPSMQT